MPYTAHCTLHTQHCTLHTAHYIIHCTIYTVHYTIQCTMHNAQYTIFCTLHNKVYPPSPKHCLSTCLRKNHLKLLVLPSHTLVGLENDYTPKRKYSQLGILYPNRESYIYTRGYLPELGIGDYGHWLCLRTPKSLISNSRKHPRLGIWYHHFFLLHKTLGTGT